MFVWRDVDGSCSFGFGEEARVCLSYTQSVRVDGFTTALLCDLLVGRPTQGFSAVRQHQLQYPRWRRGAVEHALSQVGRRPDTDRVVGWEGSRRGEDVLRQARALPNGSRR